MSIRAPEGFSGSQAVVRSELPFVGGDPALAEVLPRIGRASDQVHSGIHAIFPGPPIGNEGMETVGEMQLDFDDERTNPCMDVNTLMAQIENPDTDPPQPDDFDDQTFVGPKPSFLEETQDELPVFDEDDEVDPVTERNPVKPAVPDDEHTKPTWPKIPVIQGPLGNVDQGTDEYGRALVKALTTDPDEEFVEVGDDEIEVVK
ncbi:hypothetical protein IT413_05915 [Candidatus Peregrinibacteria bacterium]|nr:hypothetical protein [Candidatus Peregrinibacteria bacterium]